MGLSWNPACDETTLEIAVAIWLTAPPLVAPMPTVCAWAPIVPASATAERKLDTIHAGLQAGEKGLPFFAMRGIIGSDLLAHRNDWKVIDNPLTEGEDPVVVLPAINPEVFLFHAAWGDRCGNVWIGNRRDLARTAHASRTTLVTVEAIYDGDLLADERMAPGTLSSTYVGAVALAPRGAWPLAMTRRYPTDMAHLHEYARLARSDEGFARYLRVHVLATSAAA